MTSSGSPETRTVRTCLRSRVARKWSISARTQGDFLVSSEQTTIRYSLWSSAALRLASRSHESESSVSSRKTT